MKIHVENTYSDGHESERDVELEVPEPKPADLEENEESDSWWWEVAYEHTGDGHGDGSHGRLHSFYRVTITEADDPEIVGRFYEWSD